jgi:alanine-synthesizing transaminase
MLLELLHNDHVLLSPGTAFNWPQPDHVRIVTLADADSLRWAVQRLGDQLTGSTEETRLARTR